MRILYLSYSDIACMTYMLKTGVDLYCPKHSARQFCLYSGYYQFPHDRYFNWGNPSHRAEIKSMIEKADVYHHSEGIKRLGPLMNYFTPRNTVVSLHGTYARHHYKRMWGDHKRGYTFVTREDPSLWSMYPWAETMPNLVNLRLYPKPNPSEDRIKIGSGGKGAKYFLEAIAKLQRKYPRIEPIVVRGKTWKECLKIKSTFNIFFDQISPYGAYGASGIESMAMGIPTLCSMNSVFYDKYPDCPIVNVRAGTLEEKLEWLITHPDERAELGKKGIEYVNRVHSVRNNIHRWIDLYKRVATR